MKALQQKRWRFSEQVEERTEGRVKIEVLNNADMGDGRACLEQLQYGGTDIVKADVSALGNFVEEFNVLGMPYIYEDPEHFWAVHNGPIGEELLRGAQMAELGMYGLTYYDGGSRCFTVPGGKYTVLEILRDLTYGFSSRKQRFLWQEHWGQGR